MDPNKNVMSFSANDSAHLAWYKDGMVSQGTSDDLDKKKPPYPFKLATGKTIDDLIGVSSNDKVHFAWYKDGTVSQGTGDDLANKRKPYTFKLAMGKTIDNLIGISSNDKVHFAWYKDGTVSQGTSDDLANKREPYHFKLADGKTTDDLIGISSNDRAHFAWYTDGTVSQGSSDDLANKRKPYKFKLAEGYQIKTTSSLTLLPKPFEWVKIPSKVYSISKYPVTNAQFKLFLDANGYAEEKYWAQDGWIVRQGSNWTEPRNWTDPNFNSDTQPVVGVSWFEAVAYCTWLSQKTGERIMLPTGDQWQYAAQGETKNAYPWGNEWDSSRCNNKQTGLSKTTPVTRFEGKDKGDSPLGVTDMAGNVYEWCLSKYNETNTRDIDRFSGYRLVRGGSWKDSSLFYFNVGYQTWYPPNMYNHDIGFRLALSLQS